MRTRSLLILIVIILVLAGSFAPSRARAQGFSLSGKILATTQNGRFTVKLYPPLNSGRPVLLTTSTSSGEFRFTNVPSSSYLLEIVVGKQLVHQEVVKLEDNMSVTIELRRPAR